MAKMDEYTPYGPEHGATLLAGGDSMKQVKPIYEYLDLHLKEAANEMLMVAPVHKLHYSEEDVTPTADTEDNRIGSFVLPDDFLRLHTLRMKSWSRPIHKSYFPGHPVYDLQQMEWSRGNKRKPVAVVDGIGDTDARVLRYYSVDAGVHEVLDFKYVAGFDEDAEYEADVAELIALHTARKICEAYGMTEQLQLMTNEINSVLENMRL